MNKVLQFEQIGGPEVLKFVDQETPEPAPNEIQITMKAAGLNRAELLFMGQQYLVDPILPSGLGFEGAGKVIAVGSEISRFKVGDRVAITPAFQQNYYGALGSIVNMPETALEPIPDNVSYIDAAAFWMAFGTAYGLLVLKGGLTENGGQTVVVNAASSSVGTAAFQIIQEHGGTSIALTRDQKKVPGLKEAGADHVIVTSEEDIVERILDLTDGRGFDIALDAIAGEAGETLANACAVEATMVVYGLLSGAPSTSPFYPMVTKGLEIKGFHLSWHLLDWPDRRSTAVTHLNRGLANGSYKPLINRVFAFDDVQDAYRYMASNDQIGKIVVEIDT